MIGEYNRRSVFFLPLVRTRVMLTIFPKYHSKKWKYFVHSREFFHPRWSWWSYDWLMDGLLMEVHYSWNERGRASCLWFRVCLIDSGIFFLCRKFLFAGWFYEWLVRFFKYTSWKQECRIRIQTRTGIQFLLLLGKNRNETPNLNRNIR